MIIHQNEPSSCFFSGHCEKKLLKFSWLYCRWSRGLFLLYGNLVFFLEGPAKDPEYAVSLCNSMVTDGFFMVCSGRVAGEQLW